MTLQDPTTIPTAALPTAAQADGPPDAALAAVQARLLAQLARWPLADGIHPVPGLPQLLVFRSSSPTSAVCGVYEPSLAVVLQGRKQVKLGADTLCYDTGHSLLTALDLPASASILDASPDRPFLSLALKLDLREVVGLLVAGDLPATVGADGPPAASGAVRAMATAPMSAPLLAALSRLLDLAAQPQDIPVLAPLLLREIHYRLLTGGHGARLRQFVAVGSQGQQVSQAIGWLRAHYAQPLRVEALAREVRMSVSSFHHHFKALTAMSPLQYQKQIRLSEARRLMLAEHLDAASAAYRVGYESPSQFSREYSRQFGLPPARDIASLRPSAAAQPA